MPATTPSLLSRPVKSGVNREALNTPPRRGAQQAPFSDMPATEVRLELGEGMGSDSATSPSTQRASSARPATEDAAGLRELHDDLLRRSEACRLLYEKPGSKRRGRGQLAGKARAYRHAAELADQLRQRLEGN